MIAEAAAGSIKLFLLVLILNNFACKIILIVQISRLSSAGFIFSFGIE